MEQKPRSRRSFTAPLATLLCSIVLAGGSCYGFLATLDSKYASLKIVFLVVFCFANSHTGSMMYACQHHNGTMVPSIVTVDNTCAFSAV